MNKMLVALILLMSNYTLAVQTVSRKYLEQKLSGPAQVEKFQAGKGVKRSAVQLGSVYDKLGLQPGDVIVSANGKVLQSLGYAQAIYGDDSVNRVVVNRNGQLIEVKAKSKK